MFPLISMEFENDVKTYGTETSYVFGCGTCEFENDVKTYGTETEHERNRERSKFENDVKTYGTETTVNCDVTTACLRMM